MTQVQERSKYINSKTKLKNKTHFGHINIKMTSFYAKRQFLDMLSSGSDPIYKDYYNKKVILYKTELIPSSNNSDDYHIRNKKYNGELLCISNKNIDGEVSIKIIDPIPSNPYHVTVISGPIHYFNILYDRSEETNYLFKMVISKKMKNVLYSDVLYYIYLFLKTDFIKIQL